MTPVVAVTIWTKVAVALGLALIIAPAAVSATAAYGELALATGAGLLIAVYRRHRRSPS